MTRRLRTDPTRARRAAELAIFLGIGIAALIARLLTH